MKKRNLSAKKKIHNFYLEKLKNPRIKKIYLEFEKNIGKHNLEKFSIAVSGGVDSMALAFLAKCHSIKKNKDYLYFTVDHKLRSTSTNEAIQTKKQLKKFAIICDILTWKNNKSFSNLQAKARENRYELIFQKSLKNKVNFVLTAHQKNDLFENFFIRLLRGSGLKGLSSFQSNKAKSAAKLFQKVYLDKLGKNISYEQASEYANKLFCNPLAIKNAIGYQKKNNTSLIESVQCGADSIISFSFTSTLSFSATSCLKNSSSF